MSKAARGSKRQCKACGANFYDLNREPIICPSCGSPFQLDNAPPEPEPEPEPKPEPEPETDTEETAATEPASDQPEFISLEEAEASEGEDIPEIADADQLVDIEDDSDDTANENEDETFLEEDDNSDTDVSGIIGGPIKPDDA